MVTFVNIFSYIWRKIPLSKIMKHFLVLAFLLPCLSLAQLTQEMDESGYFVKMNHTLNLRLDLDNDVRFFTYKGINDDYTIEPNTRLRTTLAFNYRFLSFKIGYSPRFLTLHDPDINGETKVFKLGIEAYFANWMQTLEYNRTKGYFVEGFDDPAIFPDGNDEIILLPDLKTYSVIGHTRYRFNKNYSFKAVANQNEIQTKSAGSFIPSLSYGYMEINNNNTLQDLKSFFAVIYAGYYHTFVLHKNWYSNLGISPGLGMEWNKLHTQTEDGIRVDKDNDLAFAIKTQIGVGYNSTRFYAGTALVGEATSRRNNSIIQFNNERGYFKIFVGYRFNAPRSLERAMDWMEEKNPLKKSE